MKRAAIATALYVLSASWFLGCDAPTEGAPTGTTRPTAPEKKDTDVRIRTPKGSVDVEHDREGSNKRVEVDVRRKER